MAIKDLIPWNNKGREVGMRRSSDISLESTGSCPRDTRREATADSPAIQKTAPAVTPMSM